MNIKELKEYINDLPDDMEVISYTWYMKSLEIDDINIIDNKIYL